MKHDVIIVGAGPAGIFTAYELLQHNPKMDILIFEKGHQIQKRSCPKHKVGKCVKCEPCNITTGFSGAGAFSDGKLSLSPEVGGDFPNLVGYDTVEGLINYTDDIYLKFGADTHIEGLDHKEELKNIRKRAINAGLKLVDCPIRHLGTEAAQVVYQRLQEHLLYHKNLNILFDHTVSDIIVEDDTCKGVVIKEGHVSKFFYADKVIIAAGRRGAEWLFNVCNKYHIERQPGTVDIGVRVECRNEIMEEINRAI